jgi:hypothetical protein
MKKYIFILICLLSAGNLFSQTVKVTVSNNQVLEKSYLGNGVQWSAYPQMDISERAWQKVFERVDFMKLNFIRLMLDAEEYCVTYPLGGKPEFNFDSDKMKRVYKILDYCQAKGVTVLLGEWSDPSRKTTEVDFSKHQLRYDGIQEYDPRWTYIIGELVEKLLSEKKYTCIKYYNLGNEPNGDWMDVENFNSWRRSILNLDKELKRRGLQEKVVIVGPDTAWGNDWIKMIISDKELVNIIGAYEVHQYASDKEIENGQYQKDMAFYRDYINKHDPKGTSKVFFMGEAGMVTGKNDLDQQTYVPKFQYGVWMTDFIIQSMNAGQAGLIAWDLDDAMHTAHKKGEGNSVNDYDWKVWGFWDSFGTEKGHPEWENVRPWFYTWSLMSKYVPKGSQVLQTSDTGVDGLRSTAAKYEHDGKVEYTFAMVNESDQSRTIQMNLTDSPKTNLALYQYNYFEKDMPVDAKGYPVAKAFIKKADLTKGLLVKMPGKGVIIYTTMK